MHKFTKILFCMTATPALILSNTTKKMMVNVPVANLRYSPKAHDPLVKLPTSDLSNPVQITQLLLGEQVTATDETHIDELGNTWYYVNCPQQEFFYPPIGWHGYPGWIQADALIEVENFKKINAVVSKKLTDIFDEHGKKITTLSIGTRLEIQDFNADIMKIKLPNNSLAFIKATDLYIINPIVAESIDQLRSSIIETAKKFIGDWYSWGGRSAQNDDFGISSVDCSALVHLSFLAHGLQLPRMSHEQFLRSEKIEFCYDLQPCDLIFFASITKQSTRMDHVMLYLGNDEILEATFADEHKVRIVSFQERMGKVCSTIHSGDVIEWNDDQFHVYFGSFFTDFSMIEKLRNDALKIN